MAVNQNSTAAVMHIKTRVQLLLINCAVCCLTLNLPLVIVGLESVCV